MQSENKEVINGNVFLHDVHTHMHDDIFLQTLAERMQNLENKNIKIITIGTDKVNNEKAKELAHKYQKVFYTVGLHPHDNLNEDFLESDYEKYMEDSKCVAVGECGLDYFYLQGDKEKGLIDNIDKEVDRQQSIFIKQIEFAKKYNRPLMIHGRPSEKNENNNPDGVDAYEDMLFILEKYHKEELGDSSSEKNKLEKKATGNVHFFVGNINIAQRFINLGFTFSFGGVITITREYDEVLKYIPINHIHAETDSPYVVPKDNDGKRVSKINSSENIDIIINKIAEIKNIKTEDFKIQLEKNFLRDFC